MKTWIVFLFPLAIILNQHADGYTASGNTYQTNGSSSDVQAAINAASKGATVVIPDGSYTWSQPVTSNNFVHLKAQDYGKVTITRAYTGGDLLTINASTAGNVELAGIVSGGVGTGRFTEILFCMRLVEPPSVATPIPSILTTGFKSEVAPEL